MNNKVDLLSGVLLLIGDKVLLVKPRKHKGKKHRWSIPKGHVDGNTQIENALKELSEETGIILSNLKVTDTNRVFYTKGGKLKILKAFTIILNEGDFNLNNFKKYRNKKEIYKVKLFPIWKAFGKIEQGQVPLLKKIFLYEY